MAKPVHFDLYAAEKIMRAERERVRQEALRRADTDYDRSLIEAQHRIADASVALNKAIMGLRNDAVSQELIADAAGSVLGFMYLEILFNTPTKYQNTLHSSFQLALNDGDQFTVVGEGSIHATEGGNA